MTPPVTVIVVPQAVGSRGYGCKTDGRNLLIPYNKLIDDRFSDVPEKKIGTILRERFFGLPSGD
jgi:hypothetical protein